MATEKKTVKKKATAAKTASAKSVRSEPKKILKPASSAQKKKPTPPKKVVPPAKAVGSVSKPVKKSSKSAAQGKRSTVLPIKSTAKQPAKPAKKETKQPIKSVPASPSVKTAAKAPKKVTSKVETPVAKGKVPVRKPVITPFKTSKTAPTKVVPRASLASLFESHEDVFSETPPAWVRPEWTRYYKNLYMLRTRLKNQMSGLAEDSAQEISSFGMHMADTGTDHFDRDFALSLLSADQDALYEIEQALKRIQKGTFGICEISGNPIPKARLEAIPWTRFTVEAQGQLEKDGILNRRRLGALGTITNSNGEETQGQGSGEEQDENEDKLASDRE